MTADAITGSAPRTGRRCFARCSVPVTGRVGAIGSGAPHPPRRNTCPQRGGDRRGAHCRNAGGGEDAAAAPHVEVVYRLPDRLDRREPSRSGDESVTRRPDHGVSRASEVNVVSSHARAWWARASLALVVLAVAVLIAFSDRRGLWLMAVTAAAVVVAVAAGFWFLQQRGVLRWVALAVAVGAPLAVLGIFVVQRLLWVAVMTLVVWA